MNNARLPEKDQQQDDRETFVSRAGGKLAAAIEKFHPPVKDALCADLGCNVGGFTQCLLRYAAARVYAIDTGYGVLDYSLRTDSRVIVLERTNALYLTLPQRCDLVTIDVSWTRQRLILPAAPRLIKHTGRIISLLKPHYEADPDQLKAGCLAPELAQQIFDRTCRRLARWGLNLLDSMPCPIPGRAGNREYLLYLAPLRSN